MVAMLKLSGHHLLLCSYEIFKESDLRVNMSTDFKLIGTSGRKSKKAHIKNFNWRMTGAI